jgi:hypothetical protein
MKSFLLRPVPPEFQLQTTSRTGYANGHVAY